MRLHHGFGPVYNKYSRVLILGSFPSVKSREQQFYYGHPKNRFWPLIAELANAPEPVTIEEKKALVLGSGLALWDMVESCEIEGSSDSSIRDIKINDITLILNNADIRIIAANGKKAYDLYIKHAAPQAGKDAVYLPSTSPANAAWSFEKLKDAWSVIKPYIKKTEMPKLTFEQVYELVRKVPRGKVTTYGRIALKLGNIRWARAVGYALHANPDEKLTPCYRVVNKEGRVSPAFKFGGRNVQIDLLRADGIPVTDEGYVEELWKYLV